MLNPGAEAGYQGITQYFHKENHHAASDEEPIRFDSSVVTNWMDCFPRLVMADFEKEKQAPLAHSHNRSGQQKTMTASEPNLLRQRKQTPTSGSLLGVQLSLATPSTTQA